MLAYKGHFWTQGVLLYDVCIVQCNLYIAEHTFVYRTPFLNCFFKTGIFPKIKGYFCGCKKSTSELNLRQGRKAQTKSWIIVHFRIPPIFFTGWLIHNFYIWQFWYFPPQRDVFSDRKVSSAGDTRNDRHAESALWMIFLSPLDTELQCQHFHHHHP